MSFTKLKSHFSSLKLTDRAGREKEKESKRQSEKLLVRMLNSDSSQEGKALENPRPIWKKKIIFTTQFPKLGVCFELQLFVCLRTDSEIDANSLDAETRFICLSAALRLAPWEKCYRCPSMCHVPNRRDKVRKTCCKQTRGGERKGRRRQCTCLGHTDAASQKNQLSSFRKVYTPHHGLSAGRAGNGS